MDEANDSPHRLHRSDPDNKRKYFEHSDYVARVIGARCAGAPGAMLSADTLRLIQEDDVLKPFWVETRTAHLEELPPEDLAGSPGASYIPASMAIRAGREMVLLQGPNPTPAIVDLEDTNPATIPAGGFAIVKSSEYFDMPPFLGALLVTPVRTAMYAMANVSTMIDPLFRGFLLLNILNPTPWTYRIRQRDLLLRGVFYMVAHVGALSETDYPASHTSAMGLREILQLRLQQHGMLDSAEIRNALDDWLAS